MNFAVVVFPGSNCDLDCYKAIQQLGESVEYVFHTETDLSKYDCILLPGGFSYGDYLRTGAIASFSPVMQAVKHSAQQGKLIVGICNGFQILCESGLLPGALIRNKKIKFLCQTEELIVENANTAFTSHYEKNEVIRIPIAHGEGNYYCDEETLAELEANQQIVFRYRNNPNGSLNDIAGIINRQGNVLGMMPHPERAMEAILGSLDGARVFTSIVAHGRERHVHA